MKTIAHSCILAIALLFTACASTSRPSEKDAQSLFNNYRLLFLNYDPAVTNLYCDSGRMLNTRIYPDGKKRLIEINGSDRIRSL